MEAPEVLELEGKYLRNINSTSAHMWAESDGSEFNHNFTKKG